MIRLAEPIFRTLQGEGVFVGWPSVFVRLAGCNFRCEWADGSRCDTPYSSWEPESHPFDMLELKAMLQKGDHLVITGGEPFLQEDAVTYLVQQVTSAITIETNGWVVPREQMMRYSNVLMSISPKLNTTQRHTVVEYAQRTFKLLASIRPKAFVFKFVVNDMDDFILIKLFTEAFNQFASETTKALHMATYVMAQGTSSEAIDQKQTTIANECLKHGYCYTDRLHLRLWGGGKGR